MISIHVGFITVFKLLVKVSILHYDYKTFFTIIKLKSIDYVNLRFTYLIIFKFITGFAILIILLSAVVTIVTTLSMSAICSNGEVKGGRHTKPRRFDLYLTFIMLKIALQ